MDEQCEHWVDINRVHGFIVRRARLQQGELARRIVLEALQEMRWDNWPNQVMLPTWIVLRYCGDGPDGYYVRPNFKV